MDRKLKFRVDKENINTGLPFGGSVWCLKVFDESEKPKTIYSNEISPKDYAILTIRYGFYDFIQHLPKEFQNSPTYLSEIIEYAKKLEPNDYKNARRCAILVRSLKSFIAVQDWCNKYSKSDFDVDLYAFACGEKKKNPKFVEQVNNMPLNSILRTHEETRNIPDEDWNKHRPVFSERDRK